MAFPENVTEKSLWDSPFIVYDFHGFSVACCSFTDLHVRVHECIILDKVQFLQQKQLT
jgi:hypothetical protein